MTSESLPFWLGFLFALAILFGIWNWLDGQNEFDDD